MVLRLALAVLSALTLVGCGAKTGLEVHRFEAGIDASARDAGRPVDAGRMDAARPMDAGLDAEDARDVGLDAPDAWARDAPLDAPPTCTPGRFPLTLTTAELMLVLDRSGSMRQSIERAPAPPREEWRWFILRDALASSLGELDPRVRVGAKFFPDPPPPDSMDPLTACVASAGVDIPPAAGTADAIVASFEAPLPAGGTPTADALSRAGEVLTARRRYLLLATDGAPNCNPDPPVLPPACTCTSTILACAGVNGELNCLDDVRTVEVITGLAERGIPTYVIGIEDRTRPVFSDALDAMSIAGGRPRTEPGERRFYSVQTADQLRSVLGEITASISECGFVTPSLPAADENFSLVIDGEVVPEGGADGWVWTDRLWGELDLSGEACTRARRPGAIVESVIDACDR